MMHRFVVHASKFKSSLDRPVGAVAVSMAVAALFAGQAASDTQINPPVTLAAKSPTTKPIDWMRRIQDALVSTGTVDSVAAELASLSDESPEVLRAKARVAIENGDIAEAAKSLQAAAKRGPVDAPLLMQLAYLQEINGVAAAVQQSLRTAQTVATDPADGLAINLRMAAIAFDAGQTDDAVALLDKAASAGSAAAGQAGVVAYFYAQYDSAARCLAASAGDDVALRLLEGNASLRSGRSDAAASAFTRAFERATKPADRLYAQERLIATARQAGTLPALADRWLADVSLPPDRLLPLATILRETDRVPQLLAFWKTSSTDSVRGPAVLSERFIHEVLGAARSVGRIDDAIAVCHDLLKRYPDDPQWLAATLQGLLGAGRLNEADALLATRISAAAESPTDLERLAKSAMAIGRDEAAITAARRLATFGGTSGIAGQLLEASLHQRVGDTAKTEKVLRRAAADALSHPAALPAVTAAMETAGMNGDAIDLLQKSLRRDPSEETSSRLASLLLKENRRAEAMPVLEQLRRSGSTVSVRSQAAQRLMTAAGPTGLGELIDALRTRFRNNDGDEQDLSLLVDALLRKPDFPAAVAAIQQSKLLDESTRLNRLAVLYLRTKKFEEAGDVLRQLVDVDPDNAIVTLERLATVNLSLNRPGEAAKVIGEIEKRIGAGPTSGEMMAGVFDRLGRPAEAAAGYRRAVAAKPEMADDWLLWATAMNKAKRGSIARHRLQVLCGEATSDNVFATAVDGLLNLNAPAAALRVARRDAILRVAAHPHRTMLYHVIADLSDELHDAAAVLRATDAGVAVSDEERPQRLRELMDVAAQKGDISLAVDCGRALLALGDDFPPLLFVQLGEQLLIADRLPDAARAFARAAESSDAQLIGNRVAEMYEKYGHPAMAIATLRSSFDRQRNDVAYRQNIARLSEVVGDESAAFESYTAAMVLAARELTTANYRPDITPEQRKALQGSGLIFGPTKAELTFAQAAAGATAASRTLEQQAATLQSLRSMLAAMIDDARSAESPPVGVTGAADALRRAGFTFARSDEADAADAAVIHRWPNATEFKQTAMASRVNEGFVWQAAAFARSYQVEPSPAVRAATTDAASPASAPGSESTTGPAMASPVSPQRAAGLLPGLLARGKSDTARTLLAGVPFETVPPSTRPVDPLRAAPSPYQTLTAAASVLNEPEAATKWALFWLDTLPVAAPPAAGGAPGGAQPGGPPRPKSPFMSSANVALTQGYVRLIDVTWPLLNADGRRQLAVRLFDQVARVNDAEARGTLSLRAMQLAQAVDLPPTLDVARMSAEALAVPDIDPVRRAANVFFAVPVSDRPTVLPLAFASVPEVSQLELLNRLVGRTREPFDGDTAAAIVAAALKVVPGQSVFWDDWYTNTTQGPLLTVLADAMLRAAINPAAPDAATLTTAAAAYANAGETARADATAAKAIDLLRDPAAPAPPAAMPPGGRIIIRMPPLPVVVLRAAVASMSQKARARALAEVENVTAGDGPASQADVAWHNLMRAVLLDAIGRRSEALVALRQAYTADSTDPATAEAYLGRLSDDGRWAELVGAFAQRSNSTNGESSSFKKGVGRALQELLRWREVRAGAERSSAAIDMAAQAAVGDVNGLALSMRMLLQQFRTYSATVPLPAMPSAAGLMPANDARRQDPPPMMTGLASWPGSLDDALWAVRMPPAQGSFRGPEESNSWVVIVLVRAAAADVNVRDRIVESLKPAVEAHLLTAAQRHIVTGLATLPGYRLPAGWIDELWPAALADTSGGELRRLGQALTAQGAPGAESVLGWAEVAPGGGRGGRSRVAAPSPVSDPGDDAVAAQLTLLCDTDPASAEKELRSIRATGRLNTNAYRTGVLWARLAAERGDATAFRSRVVEVFNGWAWDHLTPKQSWAELGTSPAPDLRAALPLKNADPARRRQWLDAIRQSLNELAGQWPSETEITRQLVSLGEWSRTNQEPAAAEAFFRDAKAVADRQGLGEHHVWIADLAERLGHKDESINLQRRLLDERCLPAVRIASLLHELEQRGDADAVRQLAVDAATYFRVPTFKPAAAKTAAP